MAFKLDDIIIDRLQYAIAEDTQGNPLYVLTQLSDASISVSAESTDAVDNMGTLIKRFWRAKTGEFTATNAMINMNVIGAASGEGKKLAGDADQAITMPKIVTVAAGQTIDITGFVDGTVTVAALGENGAMGEVYQKDTAAGESKFAIAENVLTPPSAAGVTQYIVKYDRKVTSGASVTNRADKFPGTVKLTIKALCVDPCSASTLRACYIVIPSFQVSPELEISFTTEGNLNYTGALQVD